MAGVPVRVLIADDQQSMAAGTAEALASQGGFELVGVAASAAEAGALANSTQPDAVLIDAHLPGGGATAVRSILGASPSTRVLVHSGPGDGDDVVGMLRVGASGYVMRDAPAAKLAASLRAAVAGDAVFDDVIGRGDLHELMERMAEANRAYDERLVKRVRIRSVIARRALDVAFQPIVELDSRTTVGYEALARFPAWPRRGPDKWFQEAHEVGLGAELELFAVKRACEQSELLPKGVFMAVNVSPAVAELPELLGLLGEARVDHVVLEVTEHARVEDYPRFRIAIDRVRELGASLAVDDAGAGFSSLRHILELDAELIKLDGSLTRCLEMDARRRSLASALIEFGRESGAAVLAEHIESELQLSELRRLGVHYGQGFHLGRPQALPAAALAGA